jgi:hypothetical protein
VTAADSRPDQQADRHHRQRGQFVAPEPGDGRVERGDVMAGQITDGGPHADPEGRADRVQDQEPDEAHPGHAGDDAVGLAQYVDEPGDRDDLAAVPGEEPLRPGHPVRWQQHVPAEPGQQPVAAVAADDPANAVARHRGRERDHGHHRDVQPARARVERSSDHHRLARHRDAEVLQQQQKADRAVPVPVQIGRDGFEQARQYRGRHPTAPALIRRASGEGISLAQASPVRSRGMAQSFEQSFYVQVEILHDCR